MLAVFWSADFASCVLMLTLNWRTSTGLPLPSPSTNEDVFCTSLFKTLLTSITDLLKTVSNHCFFYFILFSFILFTPSVFCSRRSCVTNSSCMMPSDLSFSESDCRRNIMKDLAYYGAAIHSYLQSPLHMPEKEAPPLNSILRVIQTLRTSCSSTANRGTDSSEVEASGLWQGDSFTNRQKMCKMMRGFHVRTITINRAMGYISSGDHRK
uniref:Interleukin-12 subunit alpha n=1 Tax=Nothobranchius furzeri TaxID=105023 RepID=A0A8C6L1V3_NOTFU